MSDPSPQPRSVEEVGLRAVALTALLLRLNIELVGRDDPDRGRDVLARLAGWVEDQGIGPALTAAERDVLAAPLGGLPDDRMGPLNWRLQGLAVLLWALGRVDPLPPYHRGTAAAEVQGEMPLFQPVGEFLTECSLRPAADLRAEYDRAAFWKWRAAVALQQAEGLPPPAGETFASAVHKAAAAAHAAGVIAGVRDGDVDCDGRAYAGLTEEEWADAAATAVERHHALGWVCGHGDDWDTPRAD